MLKEGFEFPTTQYQVEEIVKTAVDSLRYIILKNEWMVNNLINILNSKLGAKIAQVSVPAHKLGIYPLIVKYLLYYNH